MFNNDAEYAKSRIVSSCMKSKENLLRVYDIKAVNNDFSTAAILAVDENKKNVIVKASDLSFNVGQLGYINEFISGIAYYLTRLPIRRDFKQGLRSSQLCYSRNGSTSTISESWFENNIKPINNCLNNKYPKLEKAIETIDESNCDVAFSKNFALNEKYALLYKGFKAGRLTKDDKIKLDFNFNFIEEELAKEVGNDKISR